MIGLKRQSFCLTKCVFEVLLLEYLLPMGTKLTVLLQKNAISIDPWVLMKVVFFLVKLFICFNLRGFTKSNLARRAAGGRRVTYTCQVSSFYVPARVGYGSIFFSLGWWWGWFPTVGCHWVGVRVHRRAFLTMACFVVSACVFVY